MIFCFLVCCSDSGVSGMNGKCVQDEVVTNKTNSETDVNGHNGNSAMPGTATARPGR